MAFVHGAGAKFYYHDTDMSPFLSEVDPGLSRKSVEIPTLGQQWVAQAIGTRALTVALSGYYDGGTTHTNGPDAAAWAVFDDANGAAHPFAYLPAGDTFAAYGYMAVSNLGTIKMTAGDDAVKFPVTLVGSSHPDRGQVLLPLVHRTTTADGTALNGGAATALGGAGYLIITAIDAGTTLTVVIQDSADNSNWAPLVSFTAATAVGSQCISLGATAAVRQYVRATFTLAVGHATFFVGFARR